MAEAAAKLAAELADLKRRIAAMERGQQFPHSTIEVGGEEVPLTDAVSAGVDALGLSAEALTAAGELGTRLDTAETDLEASKGRLDAAEADIADAFGQLDTVDSRIDTAKTDTLQAAASDAQTRADVAKAAADKAKAAADAAVAQAVNTVPDPVFALGAERWDGQTLYASSSAFLTDATAHRGTNVLQTTAVNTSLVQVASDYWQPVVSGQIWEMTAWVRVVGTLPTAGDVRLAPITKDGAGTLAYPTVATVQANALTNGWTQIKGYYTVPANIASIAFRVRLDGATTIGTVVQWSDVSLKDVTTAKTALDNAATAQTAANNAATAAAAAQTAAGNAQTTANSALTMAGSKGKVYYDTTAPSGTGTAVGDLWRQIDASKNVTAEWYWTGSVWQSSQITTSAISNLDVGKLTVGNAAIQTLVSQKIAASTAAFQTVDVKNLFATTGTLDQAVIDKLWTDVVNSRLITAQMIAVGDFTNLIPDVGFLSPEVTAMRAAQFTNGGKVAVNATTGDMDLTLTSTANSYFRPTGINQSATTYQDWIPVSPGDKFVFQVNLTLPAGMTGDLRLTGRTKNGQATSTAFSTLNPYPALVNGANTYLAEVPANCYWMLPEIRFSGLVGTASITANSLILRKRVNAVTIEDGAVTAKKLESKLVLTNEVIAGNPDGNHAKLDQTGFRVMAPPSDGAAPAEVIRLGTDTDDYFGVVGSDGNLTASITAEGGIAAKDLDIANSISLGGEDLGSKIDYMPQRLVAWGQVPIDTNAMYLNPTGSEIGLFELGWDSNQPDGRDARMYLFNLNNVLIRSSSPGQVGLRLRYTTDGTAPTVNSPVIQYSYGYVGVANGYTSFNINRIIGSNNGNYIRVLVTLWSGVSATVSVVKDSNQAFLYSTVVDLGGSVSPTAVASGGGGTNGGAAPAPPSNPTVTTTKEWTATGTKSYTGSGASYDYNTGYMYSGLSPAGYGDLRSVAVFPSLTSTLSGATINDIWIYVYYDFWYYGSGGNAAISLHGHSSLPASNPSLSYSMTSTGWPRAAGRWVRLPDSTYAGFKSGSWKGFALGGHGGGYTEYGYAHDARIKIRYTK
ncbi:minor tail protein [Arthrobacter phage Berrie]|uniref:Minor tail protein n=1 Tax=Arthrobacter phage Berrie TaxID=2926087 RepID=A0ABZ2CNF9_9CAUD